MHALVVYCHPNPESYTAAVRDVVLERLAAHGAEVKLIDLYAVGFNPVLEQADLDVYLDGPQETADYAGDVAALKGCDTLIFVYPTWWYGLPAMLKGWLDRVFLPDVAFSLPPGGPIRPTLTHVRRIGVFTTCGASRWLTMFIGAPGRRMLLRGVGILCHPRRKAVFCAHYSMDASTDESRARHLEVVAGKMDRLLGRAGGPAVTAPAAAKGEA